jgi:hypothetical protein
MNDMKLMVACKSCARSFLSPIQVDESSFEATTLVNNSYQCPHCGRSNPYSKPDHFFK